MEQGRVIRMGLEVNLCIKQDTIFTRFAGELDESTSKDVRMKLTELLEKYNIKNIVFNLKNLSFMDSSGIGMIMGRYNQVIERNGKIVLCDINEQIEKIVMMSGLLKICTLRDSEESARWFLGL